MSRQTKTDDTKKMEVQEQELVQSDGMERTYARANFIPRSDIYETEEQVVVTLDMPGAKEDTIDITLEKNILTIKGASTHAAPDDHALVFSEFQSGDYERSFRLTDQIERDAIQAVYKDGVLILTLPKAETAKTRKITVKTS